VDHRRQNRSLEGLQSNANRLKTYRANLVLFPKRNSKPKAGDASVEELKTVQQHTGTIMPISKTAPEMEYTQITTDMKVRAGAG